SVVRTGIANEIEVFGVKNGYRGLVDGNIQYLGARDVGGIIQRGGTILGSARCMEFKTIDGQKKAIRNLNQFGIDGLIVIGGNGSQTGASVLSELGVSVVGIASTIDNDLYGSDITIGVDTALNISLEAIDRLKITASSHQRAFLVEVMGRDCGYLALMTGIAGGAEAVVLPEFDISPEDIAEEVQNAYEQGKAHAIVVVAEGANYNAKKLEAYFETHKKRLGFKMRTTILGHVQRGGNPGAFDRILATRFGFAAVNCLRRNETGVLVGLLKSKISTTPYEDVISNKKELDKELFELAKIMD
ncbi:MAG: 6-phosphofructokinase, partial [Bacteroidales bacterium]|nr:6-phosphofructokinase [Bacteroidales bacterium]